MGSDVGTLLDLGWKLLLVLGLAVVAMRALRWLSSPVLNPDGPLKVVARLPIGPQQTVVVVSVGSKRLLLGQSPNQLTLLTELDAADLATAFAPLHVASPGRSFVVGGRTLRLGELPPTIEMIFDLLSKARRSQKVDSPRQSGADHEASASSGPAARLDEA